MPDDQGRLGGGDRRGGDCGFLAAGMIGVDLDTEQCGQRLDRMLRAQARALLRGGRGEDRLRCRDRGITMDRRGMGEKGRQRACALPAAHGQLVLGVQAVDVDAAAQTAVGVLLGVTDDHDPGHVPDTAPPQL